MPSRPSSEGKRLRGRAGQQARQRRLSLHPLCAECLARGIVTATTEIDHITALKDGGTDTDDNVQGLCGPCHAAKTARDMGYRQRVEIGLDGWPVT